MSSSFLAASGHTAVGKFGGGFQGTNGGGSFTHNRWYASLFYDGPSGSWMQGIDGGLVVHYIGQYWDAPVTRAAGSRFLDPTTGLPFPATLLRILASRTR